MSRLTMLDVGASAPPHPERDAPGVVTWLATDGTVWGHAYRVGAERWVSLPRVGRFRIGARTGEVVAIPDEGVDEAFVVDVYRRCVLPLALHAHGAEVLHASGVATDGGALALCGHAHTGKSTLAYALTLRGHEPWADDAVVFEVDGSDAVAVAQPFYLRLRPSARAFFGTNTETATSKDVTLHVPGRLPLAAVVLLERTDEGVELRRLRPAEALYATLEHAYAYDLADAARKRQMIQTYTELVASIPTWRLRFRPGFEQIDEVTEAAERAFTESVDDG